MKVKAPIFIAECIYLFIIISSVSNLRYQLTLQNSWYKVFLISILVVLFLDVLYLSISMRENHGRISLMIILAVLFLCYEMVISYFNGLFYIVGIVRDVLPWPLTFAVLYTHIKKYGIPKRYPLLTVLGLSLCCLLSIPNIARHLIDYGRSGGVIFPVYYCIAYLGIAMRICKKKIIYPFMIVVAVLLIVSTKRAGTLVLLVGVVLYLLMDAHIQGDLKRRARRMILYFALLMIGVAVIYVVITKYNIITFSRFTTLSEDEGSGRGLIWRTVMQHFMDSPVPQKIFGHGYHSVAYTVYIWAQAHSMAHNSYMETLYDYGVVGLLFVSLFTIYLLISTIQMFRARSRNLPAMAYAMVGTVIFGLVSYFFEQSIIIMVYLVIWSICLGDEKQRNSLKRKKRNL